MPRKFSLRALAPVMGVLLILVSLFSLSWGQFDISFVQVLASLAHAAGLPMLTDVAVTPEQEAVLWHIRFPRTFVGLMVGASLGASGTVMQGIFSNPLADPGIIGVSSGAAVGAVIAISLGLSEESMFFLPMFAFLGSLAAVSLTVMLSMRHGKIPVMMLLLAGVVVGMLLGAITAGILTVISEQKMQQYLFWTIGSLDYRRWEHVLLGVGPICIGLAVMLFMARRRDARHALSSHSACRRVHDNGDGRLHQRQHRICRTHRAAYDAHDRRSRPQASAPREHPCGRDAACVLRYARAHRPRPHRDSRRYHDRTARHAVFPLAPAEESADALVTERRG